VAEDTALAVVHGPVSAADPLGLFDHSVDSFGAGVRDVVGQHRPGWPALRRGHHHGTAAITSAGPSVKTRSRCRSRLHLPSFRAPGRWAAPAQNRRARPGSPHDEGARYELVQRDRLTKSTFDFPVNEQRLLIEVERSLPVPRWSCGRPMLPIVIASRARSRPRRR
jgi:hypothetical protein